LAIAAPSSLAVTSAGGIAEAQDGLAGLTFGDDHKDITRFDDRVAVGDEDLVAAADGGDQAVVRRLGASAA